MFVRTAVRNKYLSLSTPKPMLLKLGAAVPQGAVKLNSGSSDIFKYQKKNVYIIDPLKKLNKLVTINTNQWYR
jgi:hypothetical protein